MTIVLLTPCFWFVIAIIGAIQKEARLIHVEGACLSKLLQSAANLFGSVQRQQLERGEQRQLEMAVHKEAQSYKDPETFEEQSRRTFLANSTLAVGGVISLVLTVPLVGSLIPESLLSPAKAAKGVWAGLRKSDVISLNAKPGEPVKINFDFKYADGYLPLADDPHSVWGIKLTPEQEKSFKDKRPDLYANPAAAVNYDAITMSFVMFSSICPHLGCEYDWKAEQKRFVCPCHGSQFGLLGDKLAGPTPRGLDPLPFRDNNGQAQVTWIQYKAGQPDRLIVAYS